MKKILFLTYAMNSGGVEVSLLNLLRKLSKYDDLKITLCLLSKEGVYLNDIPKNVEIVELLDYKEKKLIKKLDLKGETLLEKIRMISYKIIKRINLRLYFNLISRKVKDLNDFYDIAVDFHGYGYFGSVYLVNRIKAKIKLTFIHSEQIDWIKNIYKDFKKYNYILCVSKSCKYVFEQNYPQLKNKTFVCRNVIDIEKVKSMSLENTNLKLNKMWNFATVGRLEYEKGYDLLIKIAKKLKENNIDFNWYIIGTGSLYENIKKELILNKLENNVILLGMQKNPYPFIKACDIYIQPSRYEGYGIAIAEARILKKPVIATKIKCIEEHVTNDFNGYLCNFDENDFFDKIVYLITNNEKFLEIKENLNKEKDVDENDFMNIVEGL